MSRGYSPGVDIVASLGTAAKRWLRVFTLRISDGTADHLVADLRDALKIRGKAVDVPTVDGSSPSYNADTGVIGWVASSIDVDSQIMASAADTATNATSYIDIPLMTLTTVGTKTKTYICMAAFSFSLSKANRTVYFCINEDGVDKAWSEQFALVTNTAAVQNVTLFWLTSAIAAGKVIKARFKADALGDATVTVSRRTFMIRGLL